jgi:hypothetical protein
MKTLIKSLMIVMLFWHCQISLYSQSKLEASLGGGIPELFNIKIRYGQNFQVAASVGYYAMNWFGSTVYDWSYTIECLYHFSGVSKHVDLHTWYISGALGFYDFELMTAFGMAYDNFDIGFNPRVGKTFYFSEMFGVNLDLGIFIPLSKIPEDEEFLTDPIKYALLPSGSFGFFIRFL